jgi:hypothetical protein
VFTLLTQGFSSGENNSLITDGLKNLKFEVFLIKLCLYYFSSYNIPKFSLELNSDPTISFLLYSTPTTLLELIKTPTLNLNTNPNPIINLSTSALPNISLKLTTC